MRYYLEDDGTSYGVETPHRKGKATLPVVVPMIIKGLCETHPAMKPYGLESFMTQQLLDTGILDWIDSKEDTTGDISELWYHQLQDGISGDGFNYTPEQMAELFESPSWGKVWGKMDKFFTPAIYEYMSDASNFDAVPEVPANAAQALHRALADNSVVTGWEPQHRIQFFHSKADVIVPYGNYLSFRDAHLQDENSMYRIDDTFSASDHFDAGTVFMMTLLTLKSYGSCFNRICEGNTPTGIDEMADVRDKRPEVWYDLSGRRLAGKPTQQGIYINGGRKVVITPNHLR